MSKNWREISNKGQSPDGFAPSPVPGSNISSTPPLRLTRGCRRKLFMLLGYLLILIAGGVLLYKFVPTEVVNAIKNAYWEPTLDEPAK